MVGQSQEATTRRRTGRGGPGTALAFLLLPGIMIALSGCTITEESLVSGISETPPPPGQVRQIVVEPQNRVIFGPDPLHGGQTIPVLGGNIYLFGPEMKFPFQGDGTLVVKCQPILPANVPGPQPTPVVCSFPKKTLRESCLKKTMYGWGYSVFLPWVDYRPDITKFQFQVCYQDDKGGLPVYSDVSMISLTSGPQDQPTVYTYQETGNRTFISGNKPGVSGVQPAGAIQAPVPSAGTVPQGAVH